MRELKKQIHEAKGAYEAIRYPGDLSRELLGAEGRRGLVIAAWWVAGVTGAIAAMIAVAVRMHPSEGGKKPAQPGPVVSSQPARPPAYVETVELIRGVPVSAYVMDVKSGMRHAVDQIALGMDGAVDSPVVRGSVRTVRQITDEIEETIKPIGERLKPKFQ
jgi:hypothetical protein